MVCILQRRTADDLLKLLGAGDITWMFGGYMDAD